MKTKFHRLRWAVLAAGLLMSVRAARSQDNGKKPSSYAPVDIHESFSAILSLRFAVDDLKAYYLEAAAVGSCKPSSRQLSDWFWNDTAAGAGIIALREVGLASKDERLKAVLGNFMVPAVRVAMMS